MAAYVQKDLGQCEAGAIIEVTPAQAGNVFLMDERNLALYRRGRGARGVGGPAAAGVPMRLVVLETGRWFVVVDVNGGRGRIRASLRRLPPAAIDADITETARMTVGADQLLGGR